MAFVTRCPYCGMVWRLPDRETADRGPVRCSACQHSFDATCELLCVVDELFPELPKPVTARMPHFSRPAPEPAPMPAPEMFTSPVTPPRAPEEPLVLAPEPQSAPEPQPAMPEPIVVQPPVAEPEPEPEPEAVIESAVDTPEPAPQPQPVPEPVAAPDPTPAPEVVHVSHADTIALANTASSARTEPSLRLVAVAGKREPRLTSEPAQQAAQTAEPQLHAKTTAPVAPPQPGRIIPAESIQKPVRVVMAAGHDGKRAVRRRSNNYSGMGSIILALVLIVLLCAVAAVIFNQRLIANFPQTEPFFKELCGKIPCPGYFLSDPSAFTVSRTNLRPLDESGNYALDVTVANTSSFAQAVPWLELKLLDENDGVLMTKTLSPDDYLNDPIRTRSIAPNRLLKIRVSLQTNVTSARCVVKPTYPEQPIQ